MQVLAEMKNGKNLWFKSRISYAVTYAQFNKIKITIEMICKFEK